MMVNKIQCYEDASGKIHKNVLDAQRADLAIWLQKTQTVNEAGARALAEHITRNRETLAELVFMLEATCAELPLPVAEAAPHHPAEWTTGPLNVPAEWLAVGGIEA